MPCKCPLCNHPATSLTTPPPLDLYRCENCTVHFRAAPSPHENHDHFTDLDMHAYEDSVRVTRELSYTSLIERVKMTVPGGRWLDVGCSFGWLLRFVHEAGYEAYGIDPSPAATARLQDQPYFVTTGAYPEVDGGGVPYHVISFFDVLEHLEDPLTVLGNVRHHLARNGMLVIQVPDRACLLYWLGLQLYRAGISAPLERLYLETFDFPHLFYFNARSLTALLDRAGFRMLFQERLPIGRIRDTRARIRYPGSGSTLQTEVMIRGTQAVLALEQAAGYGGLLRVFAVPC